MEAQAPYLVRPVDEPRDGVQRVAKVMPLRSADDDDAAHSPSRGRSNGDRVDEPARDVC